MTAVLHNEGRIRWSGSRDEQGYREYKLVNLVRADPADGPDTIRKTPGLPIAGARWTFGNDNDIAAYCTNKMTTSYYKPPSAGEPHRYWSVEQVFTTKPFEQELIFDPVDNPLLQPQKLSGSFVKYTQQISVDKNGNLLESSSHETLRGPQVEFDFNRPTVRVEQNIIYLGLPQFTAMIDTVNSTSMWGLGPRRIKLSNASWTRKTYSGFNRYYTRVFEFDIDFSTFDRVVPDEGFLVFDEGRDGGNRANPSHYIRYKDANGENAGKVWLDGNGSVNTTGTPVPITIQHYAESNFLHLGIPVSRLL